MLGPFAERVECEHGGWRALCVFGERTTGFKGEWRDRHVRFNEMDSK